MMWNLKCGLIIWQETVDVFVPYFLVFQMTAWFLQMLILYIYGWEHAFLFLSLLQLQSLSWDIVIALSIYIYIYNMHNWGTPKHHLIYKKIIFCADKFSPVFEVEDVGVSETVVQLNTQEINQLKGMLFY